MNLIALIKSDCANYFPDSGGKGTIKNYCCLIDKTCIYFGDSGRCNYFETSVLPLNPELEFKYKSTQGMNVLTLQKSCKQCLNMFIPKSNKQKYCDDCIEVRRREQSKLRMRSKRKVV